jgi:hypothetical protein
MRATSPQRALAPEVRLSKGSLSNVTTVLFRLPKRVHSGLGVLKTVPKGGKPSPIAYGIYGTAEAVPFVRTCSEFFRNLFYRVAVCDGFQNSGSAFSILSVG